MSTQLIHSKTHYFLAFLVLALSYCVTGYLGLRLAVEPGYATAIWPPSGISLAAILILGYRLWPAVFTGSFLINVLNAYYSAEAFTLQNIIISTWIGMGATLQACIGAWLIRKYLGFPNPLTTSRSIILFILLGGPLASLINSISSVSFLVILGKIDLEVAVINWMTWWVGDTIGILIFAPLVLIFFAQPANVWRNRIYTTALPLVLVFLIVIAFSHQIQLSEKIKQKLNYSQQTLLLGRTLHIGFDNLIHILHSIETLFLTSDIAVGRNTFQEFARHLIETNPHIQALEWSPVVMDADRNYYEETIRAEGYTGFTITERDSQGKLIVADTRKYYVPVDYIEPFATNEAAFGFDLASNPTRRIAMNKANQHGQAIATERIKLVQDTIGRYGILVFYPMFKSGKITQLSGNNDANVIHGYILSVFYIADVIDTLLTDFNNEHFRIWLIDETSTEPALLFTNTQLRHFDAPLPDQSVLSPDSYATSVKIEFASRQWKLVVEPTNAYLINNQSWLPYYFLSGGLLFTGILIGLLMVLTGRNYIFEEEVINKTSELVKANKLLESEIVERETIEGQLLQSRKLEAVGQLTGGIAHDFNNLLNVILGNIELLKTRLNLDDTKSNHYIEQALTGVQRGATLTQRLLAFSRKQMLSPEVFDLNVMIRDMYDLLQRTLGEHIEIEVVCAGGLWVCNVDKIQMENVLLNLAINARDAMPKGGKLTIETANVWLDDAYCENCVELSPGQYVMLAITDTGKGMSEETLEHVYEPFFTTKAVGQGSGLGLSMAFGFAKQSAGHINIYSEEGEGTCIKFYQPRYHGLEVKQNIVPNQNIEQAQGEMILLVEDEKNLLELYITQLESLGYTVLNARNGNEALAIFSQHNDINLLLTDVVLTGTMSGKDIADEITRQQADIKIIYMSGYTENAVVHHGRLDPETELLRKPFTLSDLSKKLRKVLG